MKFRKILRMRVRSRFTFLDENVPKSVFKVYRENCPYRCLSYSEPLYITECQHGKYGQNCSSVCGNCFNNASCDLVDGTCTDCAPGYLTDYCNQSK